MEYIFLLISLHTSYNTRVAELFISEELIYLSMTVESSHATDSDKGLFILASLTFTPWHTRKQCKLQKSFLEC